MSHRGSPLRGVSTPPLTYSSPPTRSSAPGGKGKLLVASIGVNLVLAILLILWTGLRAMPLLPATRYLPPLSFPKQMLLRALSTLCGESKVCRTDTIMPHAGKKRGNRKALSCTSHDSKKMYRYVYSCTSMAEA